MLYILNKTSEEAVRQLIMIASGDDDKAVLFISDAVFLSAPEAIKRFSALDCDSFYAAEDAVEARKVTPDEGVELVDYDDMAELIEEADKIVML